MPQLQINVQRMGFEKSKAFTVDHGNTQVDAMVGGKACHFRSKLEHNWACYLEFLKTADEIQDWQFEATTLEFPAEKRGAKMWLIDFDVIENDGELTHHETKGWLKGRDLTKFQRAAKYYPERRIALVMHSKNRKDAARLRHIEKYAARIIFAPQVLGKLKGFLPLI